MLSDDRQSYFVQKIADELCKKSFVDFQDRERLLKAIRRGVNLFIKMGQELDQSVREKLHSLKRGVSEDSSEWQVLYTQYYEEALSRKGSFFREKDAVRK